MSAGCHDEELNFEGLSPRYRRVLWVVIALNGTMFLVELTAGLAARSQALQADALDFFGDTLTYGISLLVIGRPLRVRASAALFKGLSLAAFGLWVFGSTVYRMVVLGLPDAPVMGGVAVLALAVNLLSVVLLLRYRNGDANVRSVWICSRNDAIGNVAVMVAAGLVWVSASPWPDLLVAALMAGLFLWSAAHIIRQAAHEFRRPAPLAPAQAGDDAG